MKASTDEPAATAPIPLDRYAATPPYRVNGTSRQGEHTVLIRVIEGLVVAAITGVSGWLTKRSLPQPQLRRAVHVRAEPDGNRRIRLTLTKKASASGLRVFFHHEDGSMCNVVPVAASFIHSKGDTAGTFEINSQVETGGSEVRGVFFTGHAEFAGYVVVVYETNHGQYRLRADLPLSTSSKAHRIR